MPYSVQNLGASFNNKAIQAFEDSLNANEQRGWALDQVFMVQHRTCLGFSSTNTYLAVFKS